MAFGDFVAAEYFPPGALGAGEVQLQADSAVRQMQQRYQQLSAWAAQIVPAAHVIPCQVIDSYNRAVAQYRKFGQSVFQALDAKGLKVAQVVYKDGQPQLDPYDPNKYQTRILSAPLSPPVFVASGFPRCPNLYDVYSGSLAGAPGYLGRGPSIGSFGFPPLIILGLVVITAAGVAVALDKVGLIVHGYDPKPAEVVGAYMSCFESLRAGGASAEMAAARCQSAAEVGQGIPSSVWILGGLAVAGLVMLVLKRPGSRLEPAGHVDFDGVVFEGDA